MSKYLGKDKRLEIRNDAMFDFLIDHKGHELNIFWEGEDYPEIMVLKCYCGDSIRVEHEHK